MPGILPGLHSNKCVGIDFRVDGWFLKKPGRDDRLDSYECKHSGPALRSDLVGARALELGDGLGALI